MTAEADGELAFPYYYHEVSPEEWGGGYMHFRQAQTAPVDDPGSTPKTLGQAALINLVNPNPYLGWSLVMGPAVIAAWEAGPGLALALLLAFYITMIGTSMLLIYLMGQALERISRPGIDRQWIQAQRVDVNHGIEFIR